MIEPYFRVENEFCADILHFASNAIFACDFKEQMFWVGNIINHNQSKKIPLTLPKSSFMRNKVAICGTSFAFINGDEGSICIMDALQSRALQTIQSADSKIECVSIAKKSVLIGGKNGVLSKYDLNGKLLKVLMRHKDFVLLAQESEDERFIISIGYDRSILLFDSNKNATTPLNINPNSIIKCVKFSADSAILLLGDNGGNIYVIDTYTRTLLRKFQAVYSQVVEICFYNSYIFVLGANGALSLCDFYSAKIIMESFSTAPIAAFALFENSIVLSSKNSVFGYRFDDFKTHCQNLIAENDLVEAYKFANIYKFLQNEQFYLALEAKFEADMMEARILACGGNIPLAEQIISRYAEIKGEVIASCAKQIKEIPKFENLMAQKLEIRAIPMAQNNPLIRELQSYKDFEARFVKIILLAKELAKKGKKDDANAIMMPYKKIASKVAIIQEILLYPQKVDLALEAIENGDYGEYFKLKKNYRFVGIFDGEMENNAESVYFRAQNAFYKMDMAECKECISILKNFRKYRDFALNLEVKMDEVGKTLKEI
ncbi:WD40 repeat domain-containing protein [Helicobacter sp. 23-1045]